MEFLHGREVGGKFFGVERFIEGVVFSLRSATSGGRNLIIVFTSKVLAVTKVASHSSK